MFTLAIDTCDARGSVALFEEERVLSTVVHETAEDYSLWLLPAVDRALRSVGRKLPDVELYASAAGPGSFTGIRIALTTVKAWNEVWRKPIAAVSRLEALAMQARGSPGTGSNFVVSSCDAQRGQLYAAIYLTEERSLRRLGDETVVSPAELLHWASAVAGDSGVAWVSLDPTSLAAQPRWKERAAKGEILEQAPSVMAPAIGLLALKMAAQKRLSEALSLDANYIRRPDAEVKWKGYSKPATPQRQKPVPVYRVRPFERADAGAVAQLAARAPQAAQWPEKAYAEMAETGYRAWIAAAPEAAPRVSTPDAQALAGFVVTRVTHPDAEILNLAVAPENRRSGVGEALLDAALAELARSNITRVFLEVRASNSAAISFYKKHLFHSRGARLRYYQNPTDDAVLMERTL